MIYNELRKSKKNIKVEIPILIDTEKTMDLHMDLVIVWCK